MRRLQRSGRLVCMLPAVAALAMSAAAAQPPCGESDLALQVLGSGGPIPDDDRASAGYLLWHEGRARVLVDAGGGVFLRYGQAGARFEDLDLIALTHLHADHSADLPALLKGGWFSPRERGLVIAGPSGRGAFPALDEFLASLFGRGGAFAYLGEYLDADYAARLEPVTVATGARGTTMILDAAGLRVSALSVQHGIVPALAFRLEVGAGETPRTVVVSGDQTAGRPDFVDFAREADLLVMTMAVPEAVEGPAARLHAVPSRIGRVAADAGVRRLLLSHLMSRSIAALDDSVGRVRRAFGGDVVVAEDLLCLPVAAE